MIDTDEEWRTGFEVWIDTPRSIELRRRGAGEDIEVSDLGEGIGGSVDVEDAQAGFIVGLQEFIPFN